MFRSTLVALALVASVSASAYIAYTYPSSDCSGNPSSAIGIAIGFCFSTDGNSYRATSSGGNYTITRYSQTGCSGTTSASVTYASNVCSGLLGTSTKTVIASSFSPALTASDTAIAVYGATGCGGTHLVQITLIRLNLYRYPYI